MVGNTRIFPSSVNLPDFRNLGVILRILLLAEGLRLLTIFIGTASLAESFRGFTHGAILFEPALLTIVLGLFAVYPRLTKLPYRQGVGWVIILTICITLAWRQLYHSLLVMDMEGQLLRSIVLCAATTAFILAYFDWRQRRLSPALTEARLMALQARIQPHFLFNSLNSVLGLIRFEPIRAEKVLENLAELFRSLMVEQRSLVPLDQELELARAYADIEAIRLGDRLKINWHCADAPSDALVPSLILQPLLENAVLHGIEPAKEGGEIDINIFRKHDRMVLTVRNPVIDAAPTRDGNHIALENIRERLDLLFDAEAKLTYSTTKGEFVVQVELPFRIPSHTTP